MTVCLYHRTLDTPRRSWPATAAWGLEGSQLGNRGILGFTPIHWFRSGRGVKDLAAVSLLRTTGASGSGYGPLK